MVNDREYGGVFYSHDNGQHWMQKAAGLGGRDVFALKESSRRHAQSPAPIAACSISTATATDWKPMNQVAVEHTRTVYRKKKRTTMTVWKKSELEARVNDLELGSQRWYAATTAGVYSSRDEGKIWKIEPGLGQLGLRRCPRAG